MSELAWVFLAVAGVMGGLALLALLQILVALLAWGGRVGRWNPTVDQVPVADDREVAAARIRSPLPVDLAVVADLPERGRPASFAEPEPFLADRLAGAAWGAAVYGLAGPLVLAGATASWMRVGAVGFVIGVLGVGLVSPACRPPLRSEGIRTSLMAGATGGVLLLLADLGGLARLLEPLGPAAWMWFMVTCVAAGAGLGAVLAVRGVIAPLRLGGEWASRDGSWSRVRAAGSIAACSLWLGAGFAILAMTVAAGILWIHPGLVS